MLLITVFLVVETYKNSVFLAKTISLQKARSSRNWFWTGLFLGSLGLIAAGLTARHQIVCFHYFVESHGYELRLI